MNAGSLALVAALLAAVAGSLAGQQRPPQPQPQQQARPGQRPAPSVVDSTAPALEYRREVFSYRGGTRDPFMTLISSSDVRPTVNDLTLVSITYDPRGGSVAMVRERGVERPHRLRVGRTLGRLRVLQIQRNRVVFQVEEFGFERQEVLELQRSPEAVR